MTTVTGDEGSEDHADKPEKDPLDLDALEELITQWDCQEWDSDTGYALLDELRIARERLK